MAVLPLLISTELFGFQFALTCDFLKELGFTNYGKPDVHIKDILEAYGFISEKASDYAILKTMINISNDANVSCYDFDKVLWLIGSGRFYNHPEFGNNGFIGKMKDDFITLAPQFKKKCLTNGFLSSTFPLLSTLLVIDSGKTTKINTPDTEHRGC